MSLVLQSKKAFLHGERLCKDASSVSAECGQVAADVLALGAKVRWMADAVREQLKVRPQYIFVWCVLISHTIKLAASVAKIIEHKRVELEVQAKVGVSYLKEITS